MNIVAVARVKNEIDMVEAFVRHTLTFAHHLVVLDNDSSDGTLEVLDALKREGLPLTVEQDSTLGMYQSEHMTRLMREHAVERHGADWVIPLDADELVIAPEDGRLVPEDTPTNRPLAVHWHTYVPDAEDDQTEINPVLRLRHRLVDGCAGMNVLVPRQLAGLADAVLIQGNHELSVRGAICCPLLGQAYLGHFPLRSQGHYLAKIVINDLQYRIRPDRPAHFGWHYRDRYELLKHDPEAFAASFLSAARHYLRLPCENVQPGTVLDPFPYRGGRLVYTPPEDATRGWNAILSFAEELALKHGILGKCLDEAEHFSLNQAARLTASIRALVDQQRVLLQTKDRELREKEQVIHDQHRQLLEKERVVQDQDRQLLEKERCIQDQHRQLVEKEKLIHQQTRQLAGRRPFMREQRGQTDRTADHDDVADPSERV